MAFTNIGTSNVGLYTSGANFTSNVTVSAGSDLFVVNIMRRDAVNTSTITYGGNSMSLGKRQSNASGAVSEIYYLVSPPTGTNSLVITPATTGPDFRVSALWAQGADIASVLGPTGGTSGGAGAPNFTITAAPDSSMIVACFISEDGTAATAPANYTNIQETDEGTWATGSIYRVLTTGGDQSATWGGGLDDIDAVAAVAFKALTAITYSQDNSAKANILTTVSQSNSTKAALGNKIYTREDKTSLPSDDANLVLAFTSSEVADVDVDDATRISTTGSSFVIHEFKFKHTTNNEAITVTWNGQTDNAPSFSTVYLQIYNRISTTWETLDSDSSTGASTDFTLTGQASSTPSDYYDANNWVSARVYQENTN